MKIAFGSWSRCKDSNHYTINNTGSGYENIAACFDGKWRVLSEEVNETYDLVLCSSPGGNDNFTKPKNWRKLILIEEAGFGVINTDWYYEKLADINPDGYLVHSTKLIPLFESLGKPVYEFCTPYPFIQAENIKKKKSSKNKINLNMSRMKTFEANLAGTIRLCQLLPEYQFVSYGGDVDDTNRILKKIGIKNWNYHQNLGWKTYLNEISDCGLFVSLDNRHTWGRFQLDAAALGIRSVGAYSEAQNIFFPKDYMVETTDIEGCVNLVREHFGKPYIVKQEDKDKVSYEAFMNVVNKI